jgi:hypothetical protein
MKRVAPFLLAIAFNVGCQSSSLLEPETDVVDSPEHAIADGEHVGGNPHFYWLPPLVPQPSFEGEFDPGLVVTLEICRLTDTDCEPIETFTEVPVEDDHYQLNWHTKGSGLVEGTVYRLIVRVGSEQLGFADVIALTKVPGQKKNTDPFPLKIGRTLPVKFRIEAGVVGEVLVAPSEVTIKADETQDFTATVLDLHGGPLADIAVEWSIDDPDVALLDPTAGTTDDDGQTTTTATPPEDAPTLDTPTTVRAAAQGVEGTAQLTVEESTSAPVATDDDYGTGENTTLSVAAVEGLLSNDDVGDPPGTIASFGSGSLPGDASTNPAGSTVNFGAGGSLMVNGDGSFEFTPSTDFSGPFTFEYRVQNTVGFDDGLVTIVVSMPPQAVDDGPAASSVPGDDFHTALNTALVAADGSSQDLLDNDILGFPFGEIVSFGGGDLGGTVDDNPVGSPVSGCSGDCTVQVDANGAFTFTPSNDITGLFTVDYKLENAEGSSSATVTVAVGARPDPGDDARNVTGNVSINTATIPFSVLDNDVGDGVTITVNTAGTQGDVTMDASTGTFTFDPAAGFEGTTTFDYDITNGFGAATATVTLTVADMIWFIDHAAGAGDGRLSSPFNSLAAFESANGGGGANDPEAGDHIFLYERGTAYNGPVTLLDDQRLIGQDATSSLPALTGITPAPGSAALPAMNSGNATIVEIQSSSNGIALGQNNQIHGLTIGNTSGVGISGISFGTLTVRDVDITGPGQALNLTTGDVNAIFGELSSLSGAQGIRLDGVTGGTLSHTATSSLNSHTGEAVRITGSSVGFAYGGDISNSGSGIVLSSNSGSTVDLSGTLTLTTANNAAFVATGGGTVTSTGAGSTIVTTTATPLTISSTTIGSSGLTFESISATGAPNGIMLNGAGSGGFTVTGSGSVDGSGGTIQSITNRGVEVINTDNVSLSNLALTNTPLNDGGTCTGLDNSGCNAAIYLNGVTGVSLDNVDITGTIAQQGINGLNVADLTLDRSTITGAGNAVNEGGVRLFNLSGTVAVTNSEVTSSAERNVYVKNTAGTLTMVVSGNNLSETQSSGFGADGLEIALSGSAQLDLDVDNNGFYRNRTVGLQVIAEGNSVANSVDVTNNIFNAGTGIGRGIDLAAASDGQLTFNVIGNPLIWADGGTAVSVRGFGNSMVRGRINNNSDIQTDRTSGGPSGGHGISVGAEDQSDIVVEIKGNSVSNIFQDIGVQAFSRSGTGRLDATVGSNTIALQGGAAFPLYGIELRAQNNNTVCGSITGNSVTLGNGSAVFAEATSNASANVQLQGFNTNAATTWANNGNLPVAPVVESNAGTLASGICRTVTHAQP